MKPTNRCTVITSTRQQQVDAGAVVPCVTLGYATVAGAGPDLQTLADVTMAQVAKTAGLRFGKVGI